MRVGVIGGPRNQTNPQLVAAWRAAGIDARLFSPEAAYGRLGAGDVALLRVDVRESLDGVEPGLELVGALAEGGVRILNTPEALLGAHDKLETDHLLREAGLPVPRSAHVTSADELVELSFPVVVKPRFGSWGRDVFLCEDETELAGCLGSVRERRWFLANGALVQELVTRGRYDLRLIVAGGRVVGGARRDAAEGEWRTNVSLGGTISSAQLDPGAAALAEAATGAVGIDFAGVDLLPRAGGGHVVLELNGAVDFDGRYSLRGGDAYLDAAAALGLPSGAQAEMSATFAPERASRSFVRSLTD
ncbi:MAG TPA: RimK family alpha-L-glutamate ligase [Gaiellaceae bacterium]